MSQERDEKTTGYLDTVDIPPVINKTPRPTVDDMTTQLKEVHVNGNGVSHETKEQMAEAQMTIPS